MQKNPFLTLGLNETASIAEVSDAYESLSKKYKEERFLEGEVGNNATKRLAEVELAYKECMDAINNRAVFEDQGSQYHNISELIKSNRIDDAQAKLDAIEYRDAEWHYFQSIIYFKKNWLDESRKQLEVCVALDPNNSKYTEALDKLKSQQTADFNNPNKATQGDQGNAQRAGYPPPNQTARNSDACCNTCCSLMCLDSCCECCGGDLISCC